MNDTSTQVPVGFALKEKVEDLRDAILSKHPRMPTLLREIHTTLRAQPENVTLMSDEEIAVLVSGLKIQTQTEFSASMVKESKGAGSKTVAAKIKELGADAF